MDSPYKFLSYYEFTDQDARLFFGRERETQILLSDILVARLVVLFAETGTGKTSLINAGVRPRLKERGYATFLVRVFEDPIKSTRTELSTNPEVPPLRGETLADELLNLSEDIQAPLVIFFDQFEEFFISTFRNNRASAETFIHNIAELYEQVDAGVHIVFSLREDWFVEMDHFRDEVPTIFHNDSNLRLRWFDKEQAREAIRGPAAAFGVEIEPRLIVQITKDLSTQGRGIEPAQLQIICDALWSKHQGSRITLKEDYAQLGRRKGEAIAKQILDQHFDNIFGDIESDSQLNLLERLLPLLRTERNTKYGRDFDALVDLLQTDTDSLNLLLKQLEAAQLIRRGRREGLTIIELAHDYLAPQVTNLQQRVQALQLRRLLANGMRKAKERLSMHTEMPGGSSGASQSGEDTEPYYLSADKLEKVFSQVRVLGQMTSEEAAFLFEAALELGAELIFWFDQARNSGVDVWSVVKDKITDPTALIDQAENAVRLLGMIKSDESFQLLEIALRQDALAPRAVDVLGDLKTTAAIDLMMRAVKENKAVDLIIEKLGELRSMEAVAALTNLLERKDLETQVVFALERISKGRASHAATSAKEELDRWRAQQVTATGRAIQQYQLSYETKPSPQRRMVASDVKAGLGDSDWAHLLRRISERKCLPLLGPGLSQSGLDLRSKLASSWAVEYKYPFDDPDDLKHVAQFLAIEVDAMYPKEMLCEQIQNMPAPDFADYNEPLRILANLPLPTFLTTNYDDFLVQALKSTGKIPYLEICAWNRLLRKPARYVSTTMPSVDNPMVFHLWGHVTMPESLVLTEDDRLDFLMNLSADRDLIPISIQEALSNSMLLFLGYRSDEPDLQFMLRNLSAILETNLAKSHVAAQVLVVGEQASEEQVRRSVKYLDRYFETQNVRVFWGTTNDFVMTLRDRWNYEFGKESRLRI